MPTSPFFTATGFAAVIVILLAFGVACFIHTYKKAITQFPGPPIKSFWVGNLDQTLSGDVIEKWRSWHRTHGPVFQTWNGPFSRTIYVGDPSMIAQIANKNWPKAPSQYAGFKPLSGDALFAQMDQGRWHKQRKSLAPAFGPAVINAQFGSLRKYLGQYVDTLSRAAKNGSAVDLSQLNVLLTLDFVGEVAFGIDFHALSDGPSNRVLQIFETVLPELMRCGLFPLRAKFPVMKATRDMHRAISELRGMAAHAVRNCRKMNEVSGEKEMLLPKRETGKNIYEILANQKDQSGEYVFSTEELVDNYVTFLVAGGDPTAHTITFAIYEILRNPTVLARLQQELSSSIPDKGSLPSLTQVKLPYLNQIVKETLRMHGPGFGTFRYCARDTKIGDTVFPANTTLALWNPQVHHDPNLWGPTAHIFNPDRWAETASHPTPGSYFPFSYGPRNCLGQGLAMLEMTLTLATVFRRFEFEFVEGWEMEFMPSFTMCAKNGLMVKVEERKE